jgi:hypothetical protein
MVYTGTTRKGRKAEMVYQKGTQKVSPDDFTLILCFSRLWCFIKFFESFECMTMDLERCHLLILDNSDNIALRDALLERAREYSSHFRSVRLFKSWRLYQRPLLTAKVITWRDSQNGPILGMHADAMRLCETERFVMIEDDTLCPPDAVPRLLSLLHDNPRCGMATAIQPMRQSAAFIVTYPGVYYCKVEGTRMVEFVTPSPFLRGVHKIDGSGWYCFASYRDLFVQAHNRLLAVGDRTRNFAVDVLGTNFIRALGYDILADFDLWCGHYSKLGGEDFIWTRRHCRPMISKWVDEWQINMKVTNVRDKVHLDLLRRLTRRKDRS